MESERRKRRRRKRRRNLIIFISVLVIVFLGYFSVNNQFVRGLYYKVANPVSDNNPVIELGEDNTSQYISYKNSIVMFSKYSMSAFNSAGDYIYEKNYNNISSYVSQFSSLKFKKSDKYIAAYDEKGKDFVIFDNGGIFVNMKTEFPIVLVRPFDDGTFIVVTEDNSAKNKVEIYNKKGEKSFVWHSGVNYITDAILCSNSEKLVITSVDMASGTINSKMTYFDISSNVPYCENTIDDALITNLELVSSGKIIALSDNGLYYVLLDGEIINNYSFDDKMLEKFKFMKNGTIVMSFKGNGGIKSNIEIVNKDGKKIGEYESDDVVKYIDVKNNNILICKNKNVDIVSRKGFLIRTIEYDKELNRAFFIGKNNIVLIGNSEVRIVN